MPKQKTHKGAKKRVTITGTGKVKHHRCGTRKLMSHKSSKRKRRLGKAAVLCGAQATKISRMVTGN